MLKRNKQLRVCMVGAIAATAAIGLGGCGSDDDSAASADGKKLQKVRVLVGLPNFGSASPFVLANELGYYKEEGLEVEVSQVEDVTAAVTANQAEVGTSDLGTLNEAVSKGLKFKAFSGFRCNNQIRIAVAPDIATVADLDGKDIVLSTDPGNPEIALRKRALADAGWDLDTVEAKMVFAPGGSSAWAKLLASGRIALTPFYSSSKEAIDKAGGKIIVDELVNTPNDVMFAKSDWLEENADTAERFLRATLRGVAYNLDLANQEKVLGIADEAGFDTASDRYEYKAGVAVFCPNLYLEEASFKEGLAQSGVESPLPFTELTDTAALERAQSALDLDNEPVK